MQMDITKIKKHGWKPRMDSEEAVALAARILVKELGSN